LQDTLLAVGRASQGWDVPGRQPPEPTRLGEVAWLEPLPDEFLEAAIDEPPGPEARSEQIESISLAFAAALQLLPPRHGLDYRVGQQRPQASSRQLATPAVAAW
jgi:RNA polymerase sigma-70 factor (ECF subfamily)